MDLIILDDSDALSGWRNGFSWGNGFAWGYGDAPGGSGWGNGFVWGYGGRDGDGCGIPYHGFPDGDGY